MELINSSYNNNIGKFPAENRCLTGNRSSKKDRHSKINTARGPRDRRMRLSLEVAKKFFKLQDMLGFDKASNTIQWLLMNSKPAIRDLRSQPSINPSVLSNNSTPSSSSSSQERFNSCSSSSNKDKKILEKGGVKINTDQSVAKETREKARERARKRTTEKRNYIKLLGCDRYSKLIKPSCVDQDQNANPWIPFGEDQLQSTDQAEFLQKIVGDNSPMTSSDWSPSFLFNYQHNLGPNCHDEHQLISDFQILDKPWEGIGN